MEQYIHTSPGRLRIKNLLFKTPEAQDRVRKILAGIGRGIGIVEFNALTGSLLIYYNQHQIDHREIVSALRTAGYFDPEKAVTNDEYVQNAAAKALHLVAKSVSGGFMETALARTPLSFLAVVL